MTDPRNDPNQETEIEDSPATNPEDHPTTMETEAGLPPAQEPPLAQPDEDSSQQDVPEVVDLKVTRRVASEPAEREGESAATGVMPTAESAPAKGEAKFSPAKNESEKTRRKWKPKPQTGPKPLGPYAVIETGGKQYRVSVGDRVSVEKLPVEAGNTIALDRVLLLAGDGKTQVGTPVVSGASVEAMVDDHYRGDKIVVFKYKPKKRYRRRQGHRQSLTHLTITAINT